MTLEKRSSNTETRSSYYTKEIFHAFLFNIKICSATVRNIQQNQAELLP